ncbi:MAG: YaiI/YqxD family protein [Clostridia bacterium]|nr:YaiI/YqxD family protein [Clostridia bacterium]
MRVIVDADACPVKEIIVRVCREYNIEVVMVIDTSHILKSDYAKIITVDKGSDSADIYLINLAVKGDLIVTQDYGVAAMALGKGCFCINQNGMIYDLSNIDSLLLSRHIGKKIRRSGGRINSVPKRTKDDDKNFEKNFTDIIKEALA